MNNNNNYFVKVPLKYFLGLLDKEALHEATKNEISIEKEKQLVENFIKEGGVVNHTLKDLPNNLTIEQKGEDNKKLFILNIGDSIGVGHEGVEAFLIKSNVEFDIVKMVYNNIVKNNKICLSELFTEYGECKLNNKFLDFLKDKTFDLKDKLYTPLDCAKLFIQFIKESNPFIELEIIEPSVFEIGKNIGYGLLL